MKITILAISVLLLMGCASTAINYDWASYKKEVCTRNIFLKKKCQEVEKTGWVPKSKIRLSGIGTVKAEFPDGAKGEKGLITFPDLKLQN